MPTKRKILAGGAADRPARIVKADTIMPVGVTVGPLDVEGIGAWLDEDLFPRQVLEVHPGFNRKTSAGQVQLSLINSFGVIVYPIQDQRPTQ